MAPKALQVEQEPKEVSFYAWIEKTPSSMVFHVSGGVKSQDGKGQIFRTQIKDVRFLLGHLATSDPETIAELRKAIKRGDSITEDYETFLKNTLADEEWAKHVSADNVVKTDTIRSQQEEIERLKALVDAKK